MAELGETIDEGLRAEDLREIWSLANPDEKVEGFRSLSFSEAEALFLSLDTRAQSELLLALGGELSASLRAWRGVSAKPSSVASIPDRNTKSPTRTPWHTLP